jgi:ribulose bisphosphate carboxylase small subunit
MLLNRLENCVSKYAHMYVNIRVITLDNLYEIRIASYLRSDVSTLRAVT